MEGLYQKFKAFSVLTVILAVFFAIPTIVLAAGNEQMNYQGKLLDSVGNPVADGSYNMRFRLCQDSACTSAIYAESFVGADKVIVDNGLFSVMIGSVSSTLGSVDFNQVLYLEVNVGGTSTPSFEVLLPRKILGSVPNAFNAQKLDGLASSSLAVLTRANTYTATNTFADLIATGIATFGSGTDTLKVSPVSLQGGIVTGQELSGTTNIGQNIFTIKNGAYLRGADNNPTLQFGDSNFLNSANITYSTTSGALDFDGANSYIFDNDIDVVSGKGINLGGVYRMTWPSVSGGGGSFWATSSDSLIGYPDLAGNYAIVIGAAATTSDDTDLSMRLKVAGNTKLAGNLKVTGNSTTTGFSSLATTTISGYLNVANYVNVSSSTLGYYLNGQKFIWSPQDGLGNNSAVGFHAMESNTIGFLNTAVGAYVLGSNLDGSNNAAFGFNAMRNNTSGSLNTAIGNYALDHNVSGYSNTAIGLLALSSTTSGNYNVAVGEEALSSNITGNYNTAIGKGADVLLTGLTNTTAIGYNAKVGGSNMMVLGGTSSDAILVGIGTSTPDANLTIYGSLISNKLLHVSTLAIPDIFTIKDTGYVGIGTSNPALDFHVAYNRDSNLGGIIVENSSTGTSATAEVRLFNNLGQAGALYAAGSNYNFYDGVPANAFGLVSMLGNNILIANAGSDSILFANNVSSTNAIAMAINNNNIGIGTSTPNSKLSVYVDNLISSSGWTIASGTASVIAPGANFLSEVQAGDIIAVELSVLGEYILNPSALRYLPVVSVVSDTELSVNVSGYFPGGVLTENASGTKVYVYPVGRKVLSVGDALSSFFHINVLGNIGIGTQNPLSKLQVDGGSIVQGAPNEEAIKEISGETVILPSSARNIQIAGRYAYVATYAESSGGSFRVVDISDINNPKVVAGENLAGLPNAPSKSVLVVGGYVYIAYATVNTHDTFRIIDVANPTNPIVVGGDKIDGGGNDSCMAVSGKYAYLCSSNGSGVHVVDISNPHDPKLVSTFNPGVSDFWSIKVAGRNLYLGRHNTSTNFEIFDISDPYHVTKKSSITTDHWVWTIDIVGNYAYLAMGTNFGDSSATDHFRIIDISSSTNPQIISGDNVVLDGDGSANYIKVYGKYAYITQWGGSLSIVDISSSTNPLLVTKKDISGSNPPSAFPLTLAFSGRYMVVGYAPIPSPGPNNYCFKIWDVSGVEAMTGNIYNLEAGTLNVRNGTNIQGVLSVADSINVGIGGINSAGSVTGNKFFSTSTFDYTSIMQSNVNASAFDLFGQGSTSTKLNVGVYGYSTSTDFSLAGDTGSVGVLGVSNNWGVIGSGNVGGLFSGSSTGIYVTSNNNSSVAGSFIAIGTSSTAGFFEVSGNNSIALDLNGNTSINSKGINIDGFTYSIYSNNGINYFGGNVGIGTTTPQEKLSVAGNISIDAGYAYKLDGINLAYGSTTLQNFHFGNSGNVTMTGSYNISVGNNALAGNLTGANNVALGNSALRDNTGGYSNAAIGSNALRYNLTGINNAAIGTNALYSNLDGYDNVSFGYQSMTYGTSSFRNNAFGYQAMRGTTTSYNSNNNAFGSQSGLFMESANGNNLFGFRSGFHLTSGDNNVMLGTNAGYDLTTGSNNILIGNNADVVSAASSDYLNIGDTIFGNLSTHNIGIGTTTPTARLAVLGVSTTPLVYFSDDLGSTLQVNNVAFGLAFEGHTTALGPAISVVGVKNSLAIVNSPADSIYEAFGSPNTIGISFADVTFGTSSDITFEDQLGLLKLRSNYIELDSSNGVLVTDLGNGTVYSNSGVLSNTGPSSRTYKNNIATTTLNVAALLGMQIKSFNWNSNGQADFGLIAEEVQNALPEIFRNDGKTIGYLQDHLSFYLLQIAQQQNQEIKVLTEQISKINPVASDLIVSDLLESATNLDSLSVSSYASFYGTITVVGEAGFRSKVTFEKDVNFKGKMYVSRDSAGEAIIKAGDTSVEVIFTEPYISTPRIVANISASGTPTFINYNIINKTNNSFSIVLENPIADDVYFDWIAVGTIEEAAEDKNNESANNPELVDQDISTEVSSSTPESEQSTSGAEVDLPEVPAETTSSTDASSSEAGAGELPLESSSKNDIIPLVLE